MRAEKGARVAVAQAHLRRGAAIGDRAQRLGDRLRRRPRQPDELASARRHALDDWRLSATAERRLAGQQAVQQHAAGEHVALGGGALRAQHRRVERHRPRPCSQRGRRLEASSCADGERHHARLAALVDEDVCAIAGRGERRRRRGRTPGRAAPLRSRAPPPSARGTGCSASHSSSVMPARRSTATIGPVLVDAALGTRARFGMVEPRGAARGEPASRRWRRRRPADAAASSASSRCRLRVVERSQSIVSLALAEQAAQSKRPNARAGVGDEGGWRGERRSASRTGRELPRLER